MKHAVFFLNALIQLIIYTFINHETLKKKYPFAIVCVGWFAATALLYVTNLYSILPDTVYSAGKGVLLPIAVLWICYEGSIRKKALLFGLLWLNALVSEGVGYILIWNFFNIQDDYYIVMKSEHIGVSAGRLLVSTVMLINAVVIVAIMRHRKYRREKLFAPLMVILSYAAAHTIYLSIYYWINAENITQTSNLIQLIFQTLLNTFIFIQYYSTQKIGRLLIRENELSLIENEMSDNRQYFELADLKFEEITMLKADMHRQLERVTALLSEPAGKDEAADIMDSISERLEKIRAVNYCDNHTLNAVLTVKLNEERIRGIPVEVALRDCSAAGIDSYEMCSVVANMFDNAIESCLRAPDPSGTFIEIKSGIRGEFFIIKVSNSCKNELVTKTVKGSGHGYGLEIIREICKKHGGEFTVSQEEDIVVSSAFLRLKK